MEFCIMNQRSQFQSMIIDQIKNLKVANLDTLLIIHRNKNSDDKISQYLNILEEKNYGLSKIFFCKLD